MPTLRVGSVPYLVGRPLDLGLGDEPNISLQHAVPADLVRMLRAGELDVALVSSIELFRRPGYRFLPGVAVAGFGAVDSVQLFLRKPLQEVRCIALDPASRTAACLVQVLLSEGPGPTPEFIEVAPGDDPRAVEADGWLRIGDPALRETYVSDPPLIFNPSKVWHQRTGLPFIFAPWIVASGVNMEPHLAAFARARLRGQSSIERLAVEAASQWQLPLLECTRYLAEQCNYEPGESMQAALYAFRDAAAPLGLCEAQHAPEPIQSFLAHRG
jgi:chorismate dehydratase